MQKQIFIPLTDELLYEHPECIRGPLMPYNRGRPCHHEMAQQPGSRVDGRPAAQLVQCVFPNNRNVHSIRTQKIA